MDSMMTLLMPFLSVLSVFRDRDPGLNFRALENKTKGSLAVRSVCRLPLEFGICDSLVCILLFVSSASGMSCGFLDKPGAVRCDLSLLASLFLSISFLLSCSDLFTGRRQTGLAVNYYLDRT
jgi:hypothetical protein